MLKNLTIFRLNQFALDVAGLAAKLADAQFNHCGSHTLLSVGFSPVTGKDDLVHPVGDYLLFSFSVEKKLLPASVVREFVGERVALIIEQEGKKPKRKVITAIKDEVINELMPKAFGVRKDTLVLIDPKNQLLFINSTSGAVVDKFLTVFFKCVAGDVEMSLLSTKASPAAAMTDWLLNGSVPAGFTVDQDCLLKSAETNASLRFSKHPLEGSVTDHIQDGHIPSELAMTWHDRVSFTLGHDFAIKKVKLLDVVTKDVEDVDDPVAALDAEILLDAGELLALVGDMVSALGGEA